MCIRDRSKLEKTTVRPSALTSRPARIGTLGRVGRLLAAHCTASARTSLSSRIFTGTPLVACASYRGRGCRCGAHALFGAGPEASEQLSPPWPFADFESFHSIEIPTSSSTVSYTHLRAHETVLDLVCRLLLDKK